MRPWDYLIGAHMALRAICVWDLCSRQSFYCTAAMT